MKTRSAVILFVALASFAANPSTLEFPEESPEALETPLVQALERGLLTKFPEICKNLRERGVGRGRTLLRDVVNGWYRAEISCTTGARLTARMRLVESRDGFEAGSIEFDASQTDLGRLVYMQPKRAATSREKTVVSDPLIRELVSSLEASHGAECLPPRVSWLAAEGATAGSQYSHRFVRFQVSFQCGQPFVLGIDGRYYHESYFVWVDRLMKIVSI